MRELIQQLFQKVDQFKAALIRFMVISIKLLSVFLDSWLIFPKVAFLSKICSTIVTSAPPDISPDAFLSGDITNPEGCRGMKDKSSPLMAIFMEGRSTGQYTMRPPDESMLLS